MKKGNKNAITRKRKRNGSWRFGTSIATLLELCMGSLHLHPHTSTSERAIKENAPQFDLYTSCFVYHHSRCSRTISYESGPDIKNRCILSVFLTLSNLQHSTSWGILYSSISDSSTSKEPALAVLIYLEDDRAVLIPSVSLYSLLCRRRRADVQWWCSDGAVMVLWE